MDMQSICMNLRYLQQKCTKLADTDADTTVTVSRKWFKCTAAATEQESGDTDGYRSRH